MNCDLAKHNSPSDKVLIGVAFYKARYGRVFSKGISVVSRSPYSHVELAFPTLSLTNEAGTRMVKCWSSSEQDEGVRWKHIDLDYKWDVVYFHITTAQFEYLVDLCDALVGLTYDWLGIKAFLFWWRSQNQQEWFCSEAVADRLAKIGAIKLPLPASKITPGKLYDIAKMQLESPGAMMEGSSTPS